MENHKIVLSKEFIQDYSKDNDNSYEKGSHEETEEVNVPQLSVDPERLSSCSKSQEELSECIKNYYKMFLDEDPVNDEKERPTELLKCGKFFNDYESCLKKI
ncbi:hypothetical protein MACK_002971 [Theileria orientalis]|uniref:Uncharacterized protein n=1 Tax=Theileria orientalis TaxID=68886 RepID=A0A976MDX4_THEOR|nr:hypothetical protein MACK_002971 [Theileria orientalis]